MQYDVFISYSSLDKQIADAICSKLENNNVRCWVAPRDILPGKEYGEAIIEAITGCKILLLVFSVHANESPQVRREVERAVSKGKVIIPFRIEDILPTKAMEYALSNTHWLDAMTPPLEYHITRLKDTIFKLLNIDETPHNVSVPKRSESTSESLNNLIGLKVTDSSGNEIVLSEFGIVYNLYAEKVLGNAIKKHLIIEKGNTVQEIPWGKIEKIDIPNIESAKITLIDSKTLGPVKLRSGRLVGNDDSGFNMVLDLGNIRSIIPLNSKTKPTEFGKQPDLKRQFSWMMKTTNGPGQRSSFVMVYDYNKEGIILHGGYGQGPKDDRPFASMIFSSPQLKDTWIWNGSIWKLSQIEPLILQNHALAYNKSLQQNIIQGGWNGSQRIGETYLMTDDAWIKLEYQNGLDPGVRDHHVMIFDEKRESIILFGGSNMKLEFGEFTKATQIAFGDTWELRDSVWSKIQVNSPESRWGHSMAFDEDFGVAVLFGGVDGSKYFDDTWIWEGSTATWEKINPANRPTARCNHSMTYDSIAKKILLFGGKTDSNLALNDLWEWNGNDWELLIEHAPPKPRFDHGLVYDVKRNKTILFGGFDGKEWFQDTWELSF